MVLSWFIVFVPLLFQWCPPAAFEEGGKSAGVKRGFSRVLGAHESGRDALTEAGSSGAACSLNFAQKVPSNSMSCQKSDVKVSGSSSGCLCQQMGRVASSNDDTGAATALF